MKKRIGSYPRVRVESGGRAVVSQAGGVLLVETARQTALGTFAAGSLRRTCPREKIGDIAALMTPLCIAGMRAGFTATDHWPGLRALWTPDALQ